MEEIRPQDFFHASKAWLIGVNTYRSPISCLETPARDVTALRKVLEEEHGFVFNTISYQPPGQAAEVLFNPLLDPDQDRIMGFLQGIQVEPHDRVLIYFACHGMASDSQGDPEGFLLGSNADITDRSTFLPMSSVMRVLNGLACRHLLVILDCCYAGSFRWSERTRGLGMEVPKTIYYERLQEYTRSFAWQVITSSAHDQESMDILRLGIRDTKDKAEGLSPFCGLLVEALTSGAADLGYGSTQPDGIITVTELAFYLRQRIFEQLDKHNIPSNKRQMPFLFNLQRHEKGEFVFLNPAHVKKGGVKLEHQTFRNPWKGLATYSSGDSTIFYGRKRALEGWREGEISHIGLHQAVGSHSPVIVTGPSGIGKSSLVKAGLLSVHKNAGREDCIHEIRPGKNPMGLHSSKLAALHNATEKQVLLVDQYEELITVCESEKERIAFEQQLSELATRHTVIITVRADFENQFRQSPVFLAQAKCRFLVPPFSRDELREIVVQPALQEVLEYQSVEGSKEANEAFINKIVDDAVQNPGSLPLLSLALSELYEHKSGRNLLEQQYLQFNGISGILDKKATAAYEALAGDEEGQQLFRQLMYRMLSFEAGRLAKRRVYTSLGKKDEPNTTDAATQQSIIPATPIRDELHFTDTNKTTKIKVIAGQLVDPPLRLLRSDNDENNLPFIEPAHDALLRSWPLLAKWLKEKQGDSSNERRILLLKDVSAITQARLQRTAEDGKGYLWTRDPRLGEVQKQIPGWLNAEEEKFVKDSVRARNRAWLFTWSLVTLIFLALGTGALVFFIQRNNVQREARKNKALYLAAESDKYLPSDAIRLLEAANELLPDNEAIVGRMLALMPNTTGIHAFTVKDISMPVLISQVVFSEADSLFLLYRIMDTTAVLADAKGQLVGHLEIPSFAQMELFVMLNHRDLIAGTIRNRGGNFLFFWNKKGKLLKQLPVGSRINSLGVSGTERYLYGGIDETDSFHTLTMTIDLSKGLETALPQFQKAGNRIFVHPATDTFYIVSNDSIYKLADSRLTTLSAIPQEQYDRFELTADGQYLLAKNEQTKEVTAIHLHTGGSHFLGNAYEQVSTADGRILLFDWDTLRIYRADGSVIQRLKHGGDPAWGLGFSPDGEYLLYRSRREAESGPDFAVIHHLGSNTQKLINFTGLPVHMDHLKTGFVTADNYTLRLWQPSAARFAGLLRTNGNISNLHYIDSARKISLTTQYQEYAILDNTGRKILDKQITGAILDESFPYIYDCSRQGTIIILQYDGDTIVQTGQFQVPRDLYRFQFNHRKDKIICLNQNSNKLNVIDLATQKTTVLPDTMTAGPMLIHPRKNQLLLGSFSQPPVLLDLDSAGKGVKRPEVGFPESFSNSGRYLLSTSVNKDGAPVLIVSDEIKNQSYDIVFTGRIREWEIAPDEKEIAVLHQDLHSISFYEADDRGITVSKRFLYADKPTHKIVYSPDNRYLLLLHHHEMSLYNRAGSLVYTYTDLNFLHEAIFSDDGHKILARNGEFTIGEYFTPAGVLNWLKTAPVTPLKEELKEKYELGKE